MLKSQRQKDRFPTKEWQSNFLSSSQGNIWQGNNTSKSLDKVTIQACIPSRTAFEGQR